MLVTDCRELDYILFYCSFRSSTCFPDFHRINMDRSEQKAVHPDPGSWVVIWCFINKSELN